MPHLTAVRAMPLLPDRQMKFNADAAILLMRAIRPIARA